MEFGGQMGQAEAQNNRTKTSQRAKGWLKFFCICLFLQAGSIYRMWQRSEADKLAFAAYPQLETAHFLTGIISTAVIAWGGYVAMQIWHGNKNGKKMAIAFLWVQLANGLVCGVAWKLALVGLPEKDTRDAIMEINILFILNVLFVGAWMVYFKKSKRVAATYECQ